MGVVWSPTEAHVACEVESMIGTRRHKAHGAGPIMVPPKRVAALCWEGRACSLLGPSRS